MPSRHALTAPALLSIRYPVQSLPYSGFWLQIDDFQDQLAASLKLAEFFSRPLLTDSILASQFRRVTLPSSLSINSPQIPFKIARQHYEDKGSTRFFSCINKLCSDLDLPIDIRPALQQHISAKLKSHTLHIPVEIKIQFLNSGCLTKASN